MTNIARQPQCGMTTPETIPAATKPSANHAAFLRGDTDTADLAHRVASTIWSGIAAP
jgi:hypothetical protein